MHDILYRYIDFTRSYDRKVYGQWTEGMCEEILVTCLNIPFWHLLGQLYRADTHLLYQSYYLWLAGNCDCLKERSAKSGTPAACGPRLVTSETQKKWNSMNMCYYNCSVDSMHLVVSYQCSVCPRDKWQFFCARPYRI